MLTANSLVAAITTLARMLAVAGRAATRPLRRGSPTSSRPPAQLAPRPRRGSTLALQPTIPAPLAGDADYALRGEYRLIRDSDITPAATLNRPGLVGDSVS